MFSGGQAEMRRQSLTHICEANSSDRRVRKPWSGAKNRRLFARMIASRPGRIIAMVGADDQQIAIAKTIKNLRKAGVERLKRAGIARDIPQMTIEAVEFHEVSEHEIAVAGVVNCVHRPVEQGHVIRAFVYFTDALMREDIADLADGDRAPASRHDAVA